MRRVETTDVARFAGLHQHSLLQDLRLVRVHSQVVTPGWILHFLEVLRHPEAPKHGSFSDFGLKPITAAVSGATPETTGRRPVSPAG